MKAKSALDLPWIRWKRAQASRAEQTTDGSQRTRAIPVRTAAADALTEVSELIESGERGWESGAWLEAEEDLRRASNLVKAERLPKVWQGLAGAMLAELSEAQHKLPEATQLYFSATEIMDTHECHPWAELRYKCHNNLACLLKRAEQAERSEAGYIQAIRVLEQSQAHQWEHRSTLYYNLGALYHENGFHREAADMHQKTLEYLQKMPQATPQALAEAHRALALDLFFSQKHVEALQQLGSARRHLQQDSAEDAEMLAELLVMEASARLQRADLKGAEEFCLEAIHCCHQFSQRRRSGATGSLLPVLYTNLGCIYAAAGLHEASREVLEDAHLLLLGSWNTPIESLRDSHYNLWLICLQTGDLEAAARHEGRFQHLCAQVQRRRESLPESGDLSQNLVAHLPVAKAPADGLRLSFSLRTSLAIPVIAPIFG